MKVRLGDVCKINMGQSPDSSSYNEEGVGIPFFQGNADFGELHPAIRVWCNKPTKTANEGDILISVRAPIGAMNIADRKCCIGRGLAALSVNEDLCAQKYFWYCLEGKVDELNSKGTGSTFKAINKEVLSETEIPLPPLDEQCRIAAVLDKVSDLIAKRRAQLDKLDDLVKARFVEMFGDPYINSMAWKKIKIKAAVTVEPQNGMYKPQSDYVTDGSGIPILRIDGFYDGAVTDFSSLKRLRCNDNEKQKYLLNENDIVINRVNSIEYLGKCAHITGLIEETVYESNMMRIHFDPARFNPVYVTQLLRSRFVYDQVINHAKKAVNQASINQKDVLDFDIYQPSIERQNVFADFVNRADQSKLTIQQSLDKLEILKKALMQEYFNNGGYESDS